MKKTSDLFWGKKFPVGKHKMVLPDTDCIAMAMIYKGKMYGGFIKVDFQKEDILDRGFNFLIKSGKNSLKKLKEAT